jgi:predicted nicotinamide N-methyase
MSFAAPDVDRILPKLGDIVREKVNVGGETFLIARPDRPDKLLDQPAVVEASRQDDYMPYWAEIWPAARMLAKVLMTEPVAVSSSALELGCGLGLCGVVGLFRGLDLIFSDYDPTALKFASDNAHLNGFRKFRTLQLDWRSPPPDLKVSMILGADLIYEPRNVAPVIHCIETLLAPGGVALVTDQDRIPEAFLWELNNSKLRYSTQPVKAGKPGGERVKGTLYRIRHRDSE